MQSTNQIIMKKLLFFLFAFLIVNTLKADEGDRPDWAHKKGGIGIGIVGSVGSWSERVAEDNSTSTSGYNSVGLQIRYNVLQYFNAEILVGRSNESYNEEYEDQGMPVSYGWDFGGFNFAARLGVPILGGNSCFTPDCRSPLTFAPFVGIRYLGGRDRWFNKYDNMTYEGEEMFTKVAGQCGIRLEGSLPEIGGLRTSIQANFNLFEVSKTNYEDANDDENPLYYTFFNSSTSFAAFGITVWL